VLSLKRAVDFPDLFRARPQIGFELLEQAL
jgi:hypothetical protein